MKLIMDQNTLNSQTRILSHSKYIFLTFLIIVCLRICSAERPLKGDPGELGDIGFDLEQYDLQNKPKSRVRRFLSFPAKSTLTFSNKLKVPLFKAFNSEISGVFKGFIKGIYTLPNENYLTIGKDIDGDRIATYNSVESVFGSFGIDGRQCLLKAICETAMDHTSNFGLLGDIISMLLSPNHNINSSLIELKDYSAAEEYGRDEGNCELAYPSCEMSFRDLVTAGMALLQGSLSGFTEYM